MLIKIEKEDLISYLEDTSNIKGSASKVYLPKNKEELLAAFRECKEEKVPVTVSAGRTGTTGGCVPGTGAIITLENLNNILDIDKDRKIASIEAGVPLEVLEKEANKFNLTFKASPTESLAYVGGAISTSASGVRGFGYGSIRNYILEIEVLLTSGKVITIKRGEVFSERRKFNFICDAVEFNFDIPSYNLPNIKSQAGYFIKDNVDLIDIFIGSEGTLGIILSAKISLQDIPYSVFDGLIFLPTESSALDFVSKIKELKRKGEFLPAGLEFFDKNSLEFLKKDYSFIPECAAAVYFEQEAQTKEDFNSLFDKWQVLIEESGASLDKSILADTPGTREKIFEFRHKLPQLINEFLRQNKQVKRATDIAVPESKFREMYEFYKEIAKKTKIKYLNFGHIGESHLHFNFLPKNDQESIQAKECLEAFCKKAISLGGTISAEHGIGKLKKPFLRIMYSEEEIKEMAKLKKYFDPQCLLGLDNIFDKELLKKI